MREPLVYIDCTLPGDMTIAEYRRSRRALAPRPQPRLRRAIRRLAR